MVRLREGETNTGRGLEKNAVQRKQQTVQKAAAGPGALTIDSFAVADSAPAVQLQAFDDAVTHVQRLVATHGADHAPVQMRADKDSGQDTEAVHSAAANGVRGGGGKLPHYDQVQASFGRHDISGIQSHVGGAAREASEAMGARAYATGNSVAFASAPTLHTAAHEAAHVVQQRAGVALAGGVGQSGDVYEQHADRVADAVVAGKSAEGLLDLHAGGGSGAASTTQRSVQRTGEPGPHQLALRASDPDLEANVAGFSTGADVGDHINSTYTAPTRSAADSAVRQAVGHIRDSESPTLSEQVLKSALLVGAAAAGAALTPAAGVGVILGPALEDAVKEVVPNLFSGPDELALGDFEQKRIEVNVTEAQKFNEGVVSSLRAASRDDQFRLAGQWKAALTGSGLTRISEANRNHTYDAWIEGQHQSSGTGEEHGEATTGRLVVRCYFSGGNYARFTAWGAGTATIDGLNNDGGQRMADSYRTRKFGQMAIRKDISLYNGGRIIWNAGQDPQFEGFNLQEIHNANYAGTAFDEARCKLLLKLWWQDKTPADIGVSGMSNDAPALGD
jgi:hypothetical protein